MDMHGHGNLSPNCYSHFCWPIGFWKVSDIYKVFAIIFMMWMGTLIHHHTPPVTFFVGPVWEKSAELLADCRTETMLLCGIQGLSPTQIGGRIHVRHV